MIGNISKYQKKLFFGYDLIYLLLSGLILQEKNKFDYKSREKFKEIYKKLYRHKINKNFLNCPFDSIDKTLSNVFTNILIKSPKKFITISIKSNFKDEILNFINKEIIKMIDYFKNRFSFINSNSFIFSSLKHSSNSNNLKLTKIILKRNS